MIPMTIKPLIRNHLSCSKNALKLTYNKVVAYFKNIFRGSTPGPPRAVSNVAREGASNA